uniref:alpha/beta hydrolase family protein n=1 Tax=Caulobacter sp. SSI4214 TaxID=2575739 RepID=UPI00143B1FC7
MTETLPPLDDIGLAPPEPPHAATEVWQKELDSYRRAMPLSRLLGNGMEYADALRLHELAQSGVSWIEAGVWLAERNLALAREAKAAGRLDTARSYFFFGSACLRFAQVAIPTDTPNKRALYRRMVEAFAEGAALSTPPISKIEVEWGSAKLSGWLMAPAGNEAAPVVIQFGGFDGWREEYHLGAEYLVKRGVAVFLVDLPGQGEARLFNNLYMDDRAYEAVSAIIDRLHGIPALQPTYGVWGNSMGGCVAAMAAIHDERIAAACVNGGTVSPIELVERFPRFSEKIEALTGASDPAAAAAIVRRFDLSNRLDRLTSPLLQLHSVPDQVFLLENARKVHDLAASTDKSLVVWERGDHCMYNHSHEKHCLVAD